MADLFKNISGILTKSRDPNADDLHKEANESEDMEQSDDTQYHLEDCAHDIIAAVKANDPYMLADALREAFQKLEQEPHEEAGMPEGRD